MKIGNLTITHDEHFTGATIAIGDARQHVNPETAALIIGQLRPLISTGKVIAGQQ